MAHFFLHNYMGLILGWLETNLELSNVMVYFAPIVNIIESEFTQKNHFNMKQAGQVLNEYYDMLFESKLATIDESNLCPCIAHNAHGLVINADGKLYNCISLIGRDKYSIGDIFSGFSPNYTQLLNVNKWRNCLKENCAFVPLCVGGCHFDSVVKFNDIMGKYCKKEIISSQWLYLLEKNLQYKYQLESLTLIKRED